MDEAQVKFALDAIKAKASYIDAQYKKGNITLEKRNAEIKNLNEQYAEYNRGLKNFRTK